MRKIVILFAALIAGLATAAEQDAWSPKTLFKLEKSNLRETMHFVSGMSYGLTEYSKELTRKDDQKPFCIPGKGLVESPMIFEILNSKYAGRTITADQATAAVMAGLKERYPCR